MKNILLTGLTLCTFAIATKGAAQDAVQENDPYYDDVLASAPWLPSDMSDKTASCLLSPGEGKSSEQVNYNKKAWEQRISHDWQYFDIPATEGRVLVIEAAANSQGQPVYRYLSNGTQNELYEPWSSSKIMAYSAAVSVMRERGDVGGLALAGDTPIADLITSINSYEPFGKADGDSNAIATYFANVATRSYLTGLFHDQWLKLENEKVGFHGAYATKVFTPSDNYWHQDDKKVEAPYFSKSSDDPAYLSYRCEDCGLTGNKPMTTLSQAEWLKRMSFHSQDPQTAHPHLTQQDIDVLFFGPQDKVGGMMLGIGKTLPRALVKAITGSDEKANKANEWLDTYSNGQWRSFQKIGWGPSGTRSASEQVLLAQVCVPSESGNRAFTIAAQAGVPEASEANVTLAGKKMEKLLTKAFTKLYE